MKIPRNLLVARRAIDEIDVCSLVNDWNWCKKSRYWYFEFSISYQGDSDFPAVTNWFLLANENYPEGKIAIYPSYANGIVKTYFHQSNNGEIAESGLWRTGKLCLEVQGAEQGILADDEPKSAHERMGWHLRRAVDWVERAASSTLIEQGQWLELPDFLMTKPLNGLIFSEDLSSADSWTESDHRYGYVNLYKLKDHSFLIKHFHSQDGAIVNSYSWGKSIEDRISTSEFVKSMWVRLNAVPVINGWQAPNNWQELREACAIQGIQLMDILQELSPGIRDGKRHFLLVGFPFQEKMGSRNCIYQWKAIHLPYMSYGINFADGFRKGERGWFQKDRTTIYRRDKRVDWMYEENWSPYSSLLRGKYDEAVRRKKYLIIGAGTLASYISEQLVRNGVQNLTIIDNDIYKIGNNCRHVLRFEDVGSVKSVALARALNCVSPHAKVKSSDNKLSDENIAIINDYDVIIDCSANDAVVSSISRHNTNCRSRFISASFSFNADMLYLYCCETKQLMHQEFIDAFSSALKKNEGSYSLDDLPQDGIGCWSPAFPAFASDVMLAASTAIPIIIKYITSASSQIWKIIYQKKYSEDGYFIGYEEANDLY